MDNDNIPEIITGGDLSSPEWYTAGRTTVYSPLPKGQLKIWNWTGTTINIEHSEEWATGRGAKVYSVMVGDGDGDGILELITSGWANIGTGGLYGQLRIWHWIRGALTLEWSEEWLTGDDTNVQSVAIGDVDGDGVPELITGGFNLDGPEVGLMGQLRIWHWTGSELTLEHSEEWATGYHTRVNSVCVGDVDRDGALELITCGSADAGTRLRGQLRIWNWTEGTLSLEWSEEWATKGDTYARSVAVGDVDRDGIPEIITGGRARVWTRFKGQLRIWHWTGSTLHLEQSEEWATDGDTAVWSVAVGDVDGDGGSELITGGLVGTADRGIIIGNQPPPQETPFKSQLRIWRWTGTTLELEHSKEWFSKVVASSEYEIKVNEHLRRVKKRILMFT